MRNLGNVCSKAKHLITIMDQGTDVQTPFPVPVVRSTWIFHGCNSALCDYTAQGAEQLPGSDNSPKAISVHSRADQCQTSLPVSSWHALLAFVQVLECNLFLLQVGKTCGVLLHLAGRVLLRCRISVSWLQWIKLKTEELCREGMSYGLVKTIKHLSLCKHSIQDCTICGWLLLEPVEQFIPQKVINVNNL